MTQDNPQIHGCINRAIAVLEKNQSCCAINDCELLADEMRKALADLKAFRNALPDVPTKYPNAVMHEKEGVIMDSKTYKYYVTVRRLTTGAIKND